MLSLTGINWLAFVIALVVTQVLGFLWYSNTMFAKPWMKAIGKTAKQIQAATDNTVYIYSVVGAAVMLVVLVNVLGWVAAATGAALSVTGAATVAAIMWLGFIGPASLMNSVFEGRPMTLFYINAGYHLVNMVIAAVILTVL